MRRTKTARRRVKNALALIYRYGGIDGAHHKQWLLDQIVRELVDDHAAWVAGFCDGDEGPDTYAWDEGSAP